MAKRNEEIFETDNNPVKQATKYVLYVVLSFVIVTAIIGSFYTVDAGSRGVLLTWGEASLEAKTPGLHFKVPVAQSVVRMGVQTNKYATPASAASKDLQIVTSEIAVNYHLNPESVPNIYRDLGVGFQDSVINPAVQESVKSATAQYTAEELITHRSAVKAVIQDSLTQRLITRGIIVEDVNIVDFDFSDEFNHAIELKVTAEQKKLQAQNDLERIKVEAMQVEAAAIGQKNAAIAKAEGESAAIAIIQSQLSASPTYIKYMATQKWNGELPRVMTSGETSTLVSVGEIG